MKVLKTLVAVLTAGVVLSGLYGCNSEKNVSAATTQEYTVKKGDVSLTITAAGNLALSKTQDLAVDLFYTTGTKGTISSVLVEAGETVKEGQVLVTLDKDEWDEQLTALQKTLTTSQRNVTTKTTAVTDAERSLASLERAVTTAENNVDKAERTVNSKKLLVTQAELAVVSANNTLFDINEVKKIQDNIDGAEYAIKLANSILIGENPVGGIQISDIAYWTLLRANAQTELITLRAELRELLGGSSATTSADVALLVAQKKYAFEKSLLDLEDSRIAVKDAQTAVATAQTAVEDAGYAVTKQQRTLSNAKLDMEDAVLTLAETEKKFADAKAKSPEIKAPFDGFVTKVNVSGGDEVANGTTAVTVADPNRFEADILVSEMDIMKVALGGTATISLNAMTGVKLPASITHISPTATISSGVVNYSVKVELDEQAASRLQQSSSTTATANATGRAGNMQAAIDSGRMTPEQAAQFQQRMESGSFTPPDGAALPEGFTPPSGTGSGRASSQSQLPSTVTQNFQLKQGLTGTVELIVSQKSNVLLVPNGALTKAGTKRTVQVLKSDGTTETREVQIGLADWQNTEITSGLSEGEKIQISKTTTTSNSSTSTQQQQRPAGGFIIGR